MQIVAYLKSNVKLKIIRCSKTADKASNSEQLFEALLVKRLAVYPQALILNSCVEEKIDNVPVNNAVARKIVFIARNNVFGVVIFYLA